MTTLEVRASTGVSRILIGERLRNLRRHTPGRRTIVITDSNVDRLHGGCFSADARIVLDPGEETKTLATV